MTFIWITLNGSKDLNVRVNVLINWNNITYMFVSCGCVLYEVVEYEYVCII